MRVAIVIYGHSITGGGGAERRFIRLWHHLSRTGREVHLIANSELLASARAAGLIDVNDAQARVFVHATRDGNPLRVSLAIFSVLKRLHIDVVHLVLAQRALIPLYILLGASRGLKVAHTVALSWFSHPFKVSIGTRLTSRLIWSIADRIDSLYPGFVPTYAEPGGFSAKVSVSPCSFTDSAQFYPVEKDPGSILFCGRLMEAKGPLLLIESLRLLNQTSRQQWHATIAGRGPLHDRLAELIGLYGLRDRVTLTEYDDIAPIVRKSMIFASLQETENYPSQALLEAMLSGCAVVATDVGATSLLVQDATTGVLTSQSATDVAAAIARLLADPKLAGSLGESARDFVSTNHRIERFGDYIWNVWSSAASAHA